MPWLSNLFSWQTVLINTVGKIEIVGSIDTGRSAKLFTSTSHLYRLSTQHPSSYPHHFWWCSPPFFLRNYIKTSLSLSLSQQLAMPDMHKFHIRVYCTWLSPWTVQNYSDLTLPLRAWHITCIFRPKNSRGQYPNLLNNSKTLKVLLNYGQKKKKKTPNPVLKRLKLQNQALEILEIQHLRVVHPNTWTALNYVSHSLALCYGSCVFCFVF